MRLTIKYKLFLTLLLVTLVVVVCMILLVKWSFERGFLEYVNKIDVEMQGNLVQNLEQAYRKNGSWDFLQDNPRAWRKILRASFPRRGQESGRLEPHPYFKPPEAEDSHRPGAESRHRPGPPPFTMYRAGRQCVLDESRQAVTFCRRRDSSMHFREIMVDGKMVGYLGSLPRRKLSDRRDLRFSEQQSHFLLLLGLGIALISAIVALPVARQLVLPVNLLAAATRKLASGQYQTRITVDSSDELGDLSRDFNSLALTLENNEQARQQWIADISHELRTPLSVLRGEIEALQDGVHEVTSSTLDGLHNEVMNLNRLVNDLYELSISDIGALNYQKQPINVSIILERALDALREEFENKNISVGYEKNNMSARVLADPERLGQLFFNLLTNALRYTDAGGNVKVKLEKLKNSVRVTMEDSAPGVADSDLLRLFERLYRVDSSRNRGTGGSGLGLAICKNIVAAHEGAISAGNSALGGLKITLSLPMLK